MRPKFALFALALAVCWPTTMMAQTKLAVGFQPTPDVTPAFVAQEEGFFAKRGLDVDLVLGSGAIQVAGVISDSLQIGNPTIPQVMQAVDNGLDLQIVSGGNFMSADARQFAVVVRTGAAIDKPADYAGKKVGVNTIGAFLHVLFVEWLTKKGVDPKQVTFVEVGFPQMNDVMRQGQIDAVVAVDPFVSRLVQAGTGRADFDFVKEFPQGMPVVVYVAKRTWVAANRATVQGFREAMADGIAFMDKDAEKTRVDVLKYLKIPPEVLASLKKPDLRIKIEPDRLADWVKIMKSQGLVKGTIDLAQLVAQ
jgi:NitT/TauT family transport system substrate-binding protein